MYWDIVNELMDVFIGFKQKKGGISAPFKTSNFKQLL